MKKEREWFLVKRGVRGPGSHQSRQSGHNRKDGRGTICGFWRKLVLLWPVEGRFYHSLGPSRDNSCPAEWACPIPSDSPREVILRPSFSQWSCIKDCLHLRSSTTKAHLAKSQSHFKPIFGAYKTPRCFNQGVVASIFEGQSGHPRKSLVRSFVCWVNHIPQGAVSLRNWDQDFRFSFPYQSPLAFKFLSVCIWTLPSPVSSNIPFSPFINLTLNMSPHSCYTHSIFSRRRWMWLHFGFI